MEHRVLWISEDLSGFYFDYCVKETWIKKRCKDWHTDFYKFTDKKKIQLLRDKGFELTVRKPL